MGKINTVSGKDKLKINPLSNKKMNIQGATYYTASFDGLAWASPNYIAPKSVIEGGTLQPPAPEPTKVGYNFNGWIPSLPSQINSDTTFTAQWLIKQFTVVFKDLSENTLQTSIVNFGDSVTPPTAPTIPYRIFTGYWTESLLSITKNLTVYPVYKIDSAAGYQISPNLISISYGSSQLFNITKTDPTLPDIQTFSWGIDSVKNSEYVVISFNDYRFVPASSDGSEWALAVSLGVDITQVIPAGNYPRDINAVISNMFLDYIINETSYGFTSLQDAYSFGQGNLVYMIDEQGVGASYWKLVMSKTTATVSIENLNDTGNNINGKIRCFSYIENQPYEIVSNTITFTTFIPGNNIWAYITAHSSAPVGMDAIIDATGDVYNIADAQDYIDTNYPPGNYTVGTIYAIYGQDILGDFVWYEFEVQQ